MEKKAIQKQSLQEMADKIMESHPDILDMSDVKLHKTYDEVYQYDEVYHEPTADGGLVEKIRRVTV